MFLGKRFGTVGLTNCFDKHVVMSTPYFSFAGANNIIKRYLAGGEKDAVNVIVTNDDVSFTAQVRRVGLITLFVMRI